MKRRGLVLSILLLLALVFASACHADSGAHEVPSNMELVAQNEFLSLYIDRDTTEIAVVQLSSGRVWYSNPQDWNKLETQARGTAKEQLGAQFVITYDRSDRRNREANNYTDSILHGLFEIREMENGVRIDYTLGRRWKDEDYLPVVIEKRRLEEKILSNISEKDAKDLTQRYHLVYLREPTGIAPLELQGMDMKALFNGYEFVVVTDQAEALTGQILDLRSKVHTATDAEKEDLNSQIARLENQLNGIKSKVAWEILEVINNNRDDLENMSEVRFEHIEHLIDTPTYYMGRVPVFARTNLINAVKTTDYSPDDASDDRVASNLDPLQPNLETFFVPLEYRLDEDSLVVRVPVGEVIYPLEVLDNQGQSYTYPLHTIALLPNFGAAHKEKDGYIFMPDGSGALIRFDSRKYTLSYLSTPVYGRDLTEDNRARQLVLAEQTYMPVYGMKTEDTAFLAIIEDGEALARISAAKAGFSNSFNSVCPQFNVIPRADLSLGPIGSVVVYQKRIYQGDIQVRFKFLVGENADYVGMARSYRDYLVREGHLTRLEPDRDLPFYLSVAGSIPRDEPVLGVPREVIRSLTTFEQASDIVDRLLQSGVRNLKLRYKGWLRGGPEHIFPDRVRIEHAVGGKDSFAELATMLEDNGVGFYPEVNFLTVFRNSIFDGFNTRRDAAQYFDNRPKQVTEYDIAFGVSASSAKYILSPRSLPRVVDSFFDDYSEHGIGGIGLQCLGCQVNSDFRNKPETVIDRQQSAESIREQLEWISDAGYDVLVEGGNALSFPFVKGIVGAPFRSSYHDILDDTVPFYQLVLSGHMEYAGAPLNMTSDYQKMLLQSIAMGAGLHFEWAYGNTDLLTNTDYDHLYAIRFEDWLEQAIADYHKANEIFAMIRDAQISDYLELGNGESVTEYDNGCSISVNYDQRTVTVCCESSEPVVYAF